jgi:hypothetical protein
MTRNPARRLRRPIPAAARRHRDNSKKREALADRSPRPGPLRDNSKKRGALAGRRA